MSVWSAAACPIAARAQVPGFNRTDPDQAAAAKALQEPADLLWWEQCQVMGADGRSTMDSLWCQVMEGVIVGGERLARRVDRPASMGLPLPFQIDLLEPDFLYEERDRALPDGGLILGGIQFDARMQREGYWLHREHPRAARVFTRRAGEPVFVPADEIAHVYLPEHRNAVRGVTWFAPVLPLANDLADLNNAKIMRKKIEACVVGVARGFEPEQAMVPTLKDREGNPIEKFYPGMIGYAQGAESFEFNDPKPGDDGVAYLRLLLHKYAVALDVTYEMLTGELSEVNFSSFKAGRLHHQARVRQVQNTALIPQLGEKVWGWFVRYGQAFGRLPNRTIWARWSPPRFESVQPKEDAESDELEMRMGTISPPEVCARKGIDWMEQLDEWEEWQAEVERRKLRFSVHAREAEQPAMPPPARPASPPVRTNGHARPGNGSPWLT